MSYNLSSALSIMIPGRASMNMAFDVRWYFHFIDTMPCLLTFASPFISFSAVVSIPFLNVY